MVPVLFAACCPDYAALAMPYYSQGCLASSVGVPSPRLLNRYMSHVARGVEHLHQHLIAHNDIKLGNILVDGANRAHLGDLGMALDMRAGSHTVTARRVGGTRAYWSPEKVDADPRSQIDPFKVSSSVMRSCRVSGIYLRWLNYAFQWMFCDALEVSWCSLFV